MDSGSVAEILCSRVKEAYPNIRIARPKRFYDTVKNIAAPVRPSLRGGSKLFGSELSLYREKKWVPRIRNPSGSYIVNQQLPACIQLAVLCDNLCS